MTTLPVFRGFQTSRVLPVNALARPRIPSHAETAATHGRILEVPELALPAIHRRTQGSDHRAARLVGDSALHNQLCALANSLDGDVHVGYQLLVLFSAFFILRFFRGRISSATFSASARRASRAAPQVRASATDMRPPRPA